MYSLVYDFITNFHSKDIEFFKEATEHFNIDYDISSGTYDAYGHSLCDVDSRAFYVSSDINDLSDSLAYFRKLKGDE